MKKPMKRLPKRGTGEGYLDYKIKLDPFIKEWLEMFAEAEGITLSRLIHETLEARAGYKLASNSFGKIYRNIPIVKGGSNA